MVRVGIMIRPLITGDWDYARYGVLQGIEYAISEDATLTTIVDAEEIQ